MKLEKNYIIAAAVVLVIILVVYMMSGDDEQKEDYMSAGRMQNIGPVEEDEIVEFVSDNSLEKNPYNEHLSQGKYAQLVDMVEEGSPNSRENNTVMQRLNQLQDSYVPEVAQKSLPYSYDAAQPLSHYTSSNLPRVFLKGKLHDMNLTTAVRGDLKIAVHDVKRWQNQHGPEDAGGVGNGLLGSNGADLHSRLNRLQQLNKPMYLSGSGSGTGGRGGNVVDLIME